MRSKLPQFFILLLLSLAACKSEKPELGFYFWRSGSGITESEIARLESTEASVLYFRVTDLIWNRTDSRIEPSGMINEFPELPESVEAIPVIYIQNKCFLQGLDPKEVAQKLLSSLKQFESFSKVEELQIDCDWTQNSKDDYFKFLQHLKEKSGKALSVTIRLHQTKYPEITGVPPADRGMLMFYNMSNLNDPNISNFIFDPQIAEAYLVDFDAYPIPLDIALAIYAQGVLIRNNRPIDLLPAIDQNVIESSGKFDLLETNRYQCKEEGYFEGRYLNKGDILRLEIIQPENLIEAAEMLMDHFGESPGRVVFYHLEDFHLNRFSDEDFIDVLSLFD